MNPSEFLMDSLSFGSKIIGPEVGSFKDYAREKRLNVYTFHDYEDIEKTVACYKTTPISLEDYRSFLNENNWEHFGNRIIKLVKSLK